MSRNILITTIKTELEKAENLISAGHLDDIRRARIAGHSEELTELLKKVTADSCDEASANERLADLKESLSRI